MLQFCNLDRGMETETIGKNGASPKSLMSKRNFIKRFALLLTGLIVIECWAGAQNTEFKPVLITNALMQVNAFGYSYPEEYQFPYYLSNVRGNGYYMNVVNPFIFELEIQVSAPVKVKYSLYTYKKTFPQDGKRNYLQGINEWGVVNSLITQPDIDKALDKIFEFPVVTEVASGLKELSWDGYTDPKFTGQKYPIRDALYIAAHNADTGELIYLQLLGPAQIYKTLSFPGIVYRIDEHKDSNGKVIKETLSGKVIVAYSDGWPIKNITAMIMNYGGQCFYGALSYDVINQGADAIVADINKRSSGDVVAHITLTNPVVDKDNKDIKVFEWKDIKTEDGKDFIPDLVKNPSGYELGLVIDMDEMTFTGIKNGFIWDFGAYTLPVPKGNITDIEQIEKVDIKIIPNETGFIILCPTGVSAKNYTVYDLGGRVLKTGNLSGLLKETITATELRSGIYFVQLTLNKNGKEETVTKKVIIQ